MAGEQSTSPVDMIRWTFTVDSARRAEIEGHLSDLGPDVHVRGEGQFVVTWDEPEGDLDEVVAELWAIHGSSFEITHEEFHRRNLFIYHNEDDVAEHKAVA